MSSPCGGWQTCGGEKKCIPPTLGPTIENSVMVSCLIWLLALCEKSQSCVWFGANSKTRVLAKPWDQALAVGLTSSRHVLITFSGFILTPCESASHQQVGPPAKYILLLQVLFSLTYTPDVAFLTLNNNIIIHIFASIFPWNQWNNHTVFCLDSGGLANPSW